MVHKMNNPEVALVVAYNQRRVIGVGGALPWHLPADLRHFKAVTMGKPIIMGRKTHESIGSALPGRRNLVVSRTRQAMPGCECFGSVAAALASCVGEPELMVIGGGQLYAQALPMAGRIYLTEVADDRPGDVYFPELDMTQWRELSRESHEANAKNPLAYAFVVLVRA